MAKKLFRARKDRVFGGICGGLGHYLRIDPIFIRLLTIFICVFTAILPVLLVYLICCVLIPLEPKGLQPKPFKRLYRSRIDRKIGGVCGGLGQLFKMDSTILRLIVILVCFLTGLVPVILAYLVGWIIIPEEPVRTKAEEVEIEIET